VEELAIFGRRLGSVDQLENERTAGDDALASGEKVPSYDAEYRFWLG
jgi:hypothetical protein